METEPTATQALGRKIEQPSQLNIDTDKIEAGIRLFLEGIGEDPEREGLLDTPHRVAKM